MGIDKRSNNDVRLDISKGRNIKNMHLKIIRLKNDNLKVFIKWVSKDLTETFQDKIIVNPEKGNNISIHYAERGVTFTQSKYAKEWDNIKENRKQRKKKRKEEKEQDILQQIVDIINSKR